MDRHATSLLAVLAFFCVGLTAGLSVSSTISKLDSVSEECIVSGSNLMSLCVQEVNTATAFFNVTLDDKESIKNLKLTKKNIERLIDEIGEPAVECCKGTCEFSNNFCGCDKGMVSIIDAFIGGNFAFFRAVSEAVGERCGIPTYYGENCPKKKWQRKWKKYPKGDCTKF